MLVDFDQIISKLQIVFAELRIIPNSPLQAKWILTKLANPLYTASFHSGVLDIISFQHINLFQSQTNKLNFLPLHVLV
jgi:hypothetical protein